jgi:D-sedoheptulose 7-phosphate isomerase
MMADRSKDLESLYPFLHGKEKDSLQEDEALLESVRQKAEQSASENQKFFALQANALIEAARAIAVVYGQGGRMFAIGNGGSSCDASHFAIEFQHPITTGRPALPAINLCNDAAMITAVGNDVGIEHVFVRQLDALACANDGLIGFSTSGNSKNLIEAYRKAKEIGMTTIGLSGGDGGAMRQCNLVDHCLTVNTDSIHRVQEVHVIAYHILWDLVHTLHCDHRGKLGKKV